MGKRRRAKKLRFNIILAGSERGEGPDKIDEFWEFCPRKRGCANSHSR